MIKWQELYYFNLEIESLSEISGKEEAPGHMLGENHLRCEGAVNIATRHRNLLLLENDLPVDTSQPPRERNRQHKVSNTIESTQN